MRLYKLPISFPNVWYISTFLKRELAQYIWSRWALESRCLIMYYSFPQILILPNFKGFELKDEFGLIFLFQRGPHDVAAKGRLPALEAQRYHLITV